MKTPDFATAAVLHGIKNSFKKIAILRKGELPFLFGRRHFNK